MATKRKPDERQAEMFGAPELPPSEPIGHDLTALLRGRLRRPWERLPIVQRDRAHWAAPGTGPEGETCGSCRHFREAYQSAGYCNLIAYWHQPARQARLDRADKSCAEWEAPVRGGMGLGPTSNSEADEATRSEGTE